MKISDLLSAAVAITLICNCGADAGILARSEFHEHSFKAVDIVGQHARSFLDPFLKDLMNLFIRNMPNGIPWLGIPVMDPLKVPSVYLNLTDPALKVKGEITNLQGVGLAASEVTRLKTNLLLLKGEIDWELPELVITGDYDIDGTAAFIFPIYGKGAFRITVSGVTLSLSTDLTMAGQYLQVQNSYCQLNMEDFEVKFEGLLGGGDLGETLNEIINIIGHRIFDLIEPLVQEDLLVNMEGFVNSKLLEVTLDDILAGNIPSLKNDKNVPLGPSENLMAADAGSYVDQVLFNLREQMILNDFDRIVFPDQVLAFSRVILGITWHGEASIYGGLINGLETIHRSGPANLNVENGDIVFDAELEINDGTLFASMAVKFMNLGPKTSIIGTLKKVKTQMGYLTIDIKGLGLVLNFLIEIVSEFVGNLVKGLVAAVLEGSIKSLFNNIVSETAFPLTLPSVNQNSVIIETNWDSGTVTNN